MAHFADRSKDFSHDAINRLSVRNINPPTLVGGF